MSEAGYVKDEHYQFLLEYFPANIISLRFEALWRDTVKVIEGMGLEDKVRIDEESFQMVVIDYFSDIARLKAFQDISRINVNKIYGYEMYWFLRRQPIQIVEPIPDNFDINEKIAISIFLPRILKEADMPYTQSTQYSEFRSRLNIFINLLFYNIKYRTFTQQSLELVIEAFLCGSVCNQYFRDSHGTPRRESCAGEPA
ncbi:hypothetical protein AGMMS50293_01060 [Spirochaetia bacterium]|nr:hypothetical protein AGMMS50293_01060 [Spirochaetia bacterium]